MTAPTRIYLVSDEDTATKRLIRATNQAQATHHAARSRFDVKVASQDDLVNLIASGVKVEDSKEMLADQVVEHVAGLLETSQSLVTAEGGEA